MSRSPPGPSDPLAPLGCQRALYPQLDDHCWLNSAYMGLLPAPVEQAGHAALAQRAFPVALTAADFFEPADRARTLCARLVNADPERTALVSTASYGLAVVARHLRPCRGQNVVMPGEQFPSNVYPWRAWRDDGVAMRMVPAPDGPRAGSPGVASRGERWNAALLAAIDRDTALVAVEQAHWTDGTLFDLAALGARSREVGAAFVIDATQTAGAMPLDVAALQPDALVAHAYKAMQASYGLGFAVYGERFASARPVEDSWLTRQGSEHFARLVDYQDAPAAGMRRFDTPTRSNPVLVQMLIAACELLLQWQPERIRAYLLGIERDFVARVRALGWDVADEHERAANLFGLGLPPGLQPEPVRAALAARRLHVSVRGSAVRVSPHMHNDAADLARLADALAQLSPPA